MFSVCSTDKSFEIIHLSDEIDLDFTRFTFLLKIKCIKHFLKININMSLNVFVYNEDTNEIIINPTTFSIGSRKTTSYQYFVLEDSENNHYM